MSYEELKGLMRELDNLNIPYEFGNHYDSTSGIIIGHWLSITAPIFDVWDIDKEDEEWNRG